MTDTAKPTPGPWYFCPYPAGNGGFVYAGGPGGPSICDMSQYELPEQNGEFIAEAGTVYHETNLTPLQLLALSENAKSVIETNQLLVKRLKELEEARTDFLRELKHLMGVIEGYMFDAGDGIHVADTLADASALIAKHGEGV